MMRMMMMMKPLFAQRSTFSPDNEDDEGDDEDDDDEDDQDDDDEDNLSLANAPLSLLSR